MQDVKLIKIWDTSIASSTNTPGWWINFLSTVDDDTFKFNFDRYAETINHINNLLKEYHAITYTTITKDASTRYVEFETNDDYIEFRLRYG
jgi:hypothetical protein